MALDDVNALRAVASRFGPAEVLRHARALRRCAMKAIDQPDVLLAYHDCLLFMLAYPTSAAALEGGQRPGARAPCGSWHRVGRGHAQLRMGCRALARVPLSAERGDRFVR